MRWNNQTDNFPLNRIVKKFAFLPITIKNETVWLETVYIRQKRVVYYPWGPDYFLRYEYYYIDEKFVAEEDYRREHAKN